MHRRSFLTLLGTSAAAWPPAARAQQAAMPVIGVISLRTSAADARVMASFRRGLGEIRYVEGQNVTIEYRYAEGQYDRLPALAADLVRRQVTVIVTTGGAQVALAAKAATSTIPIVFTSGGDPVAEGLVNSLRSPGGNLTGATSLFEEIASKRLGLMREILPRSATIGVLVDGNDRIDRDTDVSHVRIAADAVGQKIEIFQAAI